VARAYVALQYRDIRPSFGNQILINSAAEKLVSGKAMQNWRLWMVVGVVLAGCASQDRPSEASSSYFESWDETQSRYVIGLGDKLAIQLPYQPEFNAELVVAPDGTVSPNLLGAVPAAGYEPEELASQLENLYARDLLAPQVIVTPTAFSSQKVFVGGAVNSPGIYELPGRIGVLEAVTLAGGQTAEGSNKIVVIRRTIRNTPMIRTVDVGQIVKGRSGSNDVPLRSFDIIYVPLTTGAQISRFVDQYIRGIIPLNPDFSYAVPLS
jgi:polysaccharide export outer membrane protein